MVFRPIFIAITFSIFFLGASGVHAQSSIKENDQLDFAQGLLARGMYDMAITQYQKFITEFPHSPSLPQAYLSMGEGYFLSQEFDKAFDTFNQFKQLFPHSDQIPLSTLRLGQIDIEQKKYDEAIKVFTSNDFQKQLKGPLLQSFDYYTAQAYLGRGDSASALDFLQKATQVGGATDYSSYSFEDIGKIYTQRGAYTEAVDAYAKALPLATEDSLKGEINYRTAEVEFLSGKYADAIKGFGQMLSQYPNLGFDQDALANMLLSYFNLGQYDQMVKEYQQDAKLIKYDDSFYPVHFAAVLGLIELKQYDQANTLLDRMLAFPSLKPQERARIFVKKADILNREKKFKDGLALLEAYTSENSDNADETLFLKAQDYFGLDNYDRAFNYFENVYLNFPESRFKLAALLGQAHSRKEAGRFKESEGLFLKYYSLEDQTDLKSEALYDVIIMADKAGDQNEVVKASQEYLKEFPDGEQKAQVIFTLVWNYSKNDRAKDAVGLMQEYLKTSVPPPSPNSAYFLLGLNQQLLGNNDQALAAYKQVDQHKEGGKFYFASLKNMAIIYLAQKDYDQAKSCFNLLISQSDQSDLQVKTYVWVCNEYLKKQQYDDVLRIVAQAEKHFPPQDLMEIKYFQAEALRGLGRCDEAEKDYDLVILAPQKDVYTASAHIGHGLCLASASKFDEAKAEYQKALDEDPDDYTITEHARFEMANIDASLGKFDDAVKLYLLVATIYDNEHYCSESLLQAAKISEKLNRKEDAIKLYKEILNKYKNSPAAQIANEKVGLLK